MLFPCLGAAPQKLANTSFASAHGHHEEARFLYRIAEFVDWPRSGSSGVINFCVLGVDPFGKSLDAAVLGHSIGSRRSVVVRAKSFDALGGCDVLFLSPSEAARQPRILGSLRGKGILTVGETPDFAASGGIVQFVRSDGDLRFVINIDAAKRAGLKIDSKLLALAAVVYETPKRTD